MKVVLENGGPTVATDLRVTFTPPLPDGTTSHPGDVFTALDAGVSSLAPGRSMHWTIGVGHRLLQGATARTYEVTVDAIGPFGPTEQLRYTINLSEWKQTLAVPPGTLHEVRRAIVDLNTTLKSR